MRTRAIIHIDRFLSNFNAVKARIGEKRRICVPVKANAYGHGAAKIAAESIKAGAYCLGVATVTEGLQLREKNITEPILLFSQPLPEEIKALIEANITPFVSDEWYALALNEQAKAADKKCPVHLKIDTGMGRMGCRAEEAPSLARFINDCTCLELAGTATHLAVSDSTEKKDIEYTKSQISVFTKALDAIRAAGINPGIVHAANSGAVILHPDAWFDMVRPGIFLYGYKTAEEIPGFPFEPLCAQPVMELITHVTLIKQVKRGETVSYGRTWTAPEDTFIGILPAGYADGLPRLISNNWQAVINGKTYPLAGRICMDICCVNLGKETSVKRWDEAVLFGGDAPDAAQLAKRTGTIPYEITCNVSGRVPRIYI